MLQPEIILTEDLDKIFKDFDLKQLTVVDVAFSLPNIPQSALGIFAQKRNVLQLFKDLTNFVCFAPGCRDKQKFDSLNALKKHLKERH